MAKPAEILKSLRNIIRLERTDYEFGDRAVVGGLARYAETWFQQAGQAFGPEAMPWVEAIARRLQEYSALPREQRPVAIQDILQLLETGPKGVHAAERPAGVSEASVSAAPPSVTPRAVPIASVPETPVPVQPAPMPSPVALEAPPPPPRAPKSRPEGPRPPKPAPSVPTEEPPGLKAPVTTIRGVGRKQAERLARLGIHT
ncbi:MAG: hypothetical protein D6793_12400, partial [Thermoflexia bacterium]